MILVNTIFFCYFHNAGTTSVENLRNMIISLSLTEWGIKTILIF
jgi:hypothetical protein